MLRRSFLKASFALAGCSLLPRLSWGFLADNKTIYDCIVIGAGPAGLTAARELTARKLKVLVLEGADRIGGRLFTDHTKTTDFGSPLELGAEYIHLPPGQTPLWQEVQRYGLQTKSYPRFTKGYLYNSQYLAPIPHSPLYEIARFNFKVISTYRVFKDIEKYQGPDISGTAFMRKMNYRGLKAEAAEAIFTGHQGGPLDKVSVHGMQADQVITQMKSSHDFYVQGGFDGILNGMMSEIPQGHVLLGHRVNRIIRTKNNLVQAYVPGVGWFSAKSLLCTASIGMLQSRSVDFTEFWTAEKENALKLIRPSHQMKFSIRFTSRFWESDMCALNQLQAAERRTGRSYFVPHYQEDDKPPVLTALIAGDHAKKLLPMKHNEILRLICQDLDTMYKFHDSIYGKVAKRPDGSPIYTCKKWKEDPFALGGVSYMQLDEGNNPLTTGNARQALASRNDTCPVFWAGEATALHTQPSSVHGAYLSGLTAANEIHSYLLNPA